MREKANEKGLWAYTQFEAKGQTMQHGVWMRQEEKKRGLGGDQPDEETHLRQGPSDWSAILRSP